MRVQGEIWEPVYARVSPCQNQVRAKSESASVCETEYMRAENTNQDRGEKREIGDDGRAWTACRAGSRGGSAAECARGDRGAGGGERRYWSAQAVVVGDAGEGDSGSCTRPCWRVAELPVLVLVLIGAGARRASVCC